jgi:hypothetical protein
MEALDSHQLEIEAKWFQAALASPLSDYRCGRIRWRLRPCAR